MHQVQLFHEKSHTPQNFWYQLKLGELSDATVLSQRALHCGVLDIPEKEKEQITTRQHLHV